MQENAYTSVEAEMSVLGAALQDEKCAKLAADIPPEAFFDARHKLVHAAICELVHDGEPVDLVTTDQQLETGDRLQQIGGTAYLIELAQYVPTTANVKAYVKVLYERLARRKLRAIGQRIIELSGNLEEDIDEVRERASVAIRDIHASDSVKLISMLDAAMTTYEHLEQAQRQEASDSRITSGISTLDNVLGRSIAGSKLIVVGARPGVGKSVFALTYALNAVRHGKRVLFISLEMDETEIMERVYANDANVSLSVITSGSMQADDWEKIAQSTGLLAPMPLWLCTEAHTVEQIRRAAFQLYENGGLDMIVVDYLQLMDATFAKKQNRQEQVSEISRGLKKLTQELKTPIMALCQLNRASENRSVNGARTGRQPTMADARESGSIENDANIFMLLHAPSIEEMQTDEAREIHQNLQRAGLRLIHITIDKNRQGKRGRLAVAFDGEHMRFTAIAG